MELTLEQATEILKKIQNAKDDAEIVNLAQSYGFKITGLQANMVKKMAPGMTAEQALEMAKKFL